MKNTQYKIKITLQHCSQWEQTSVWILIVDLRRVKKCLGGNRLVHKVACWARKALILCRSSFFTLSGTSADQEREKEEKRWYVRTNWTLGLEKETLNAFDRRKTFKIVMLDNWRIHWLMCCTSLIILSPVQKNGSLVAKRKISF